MNLVFPPKILHNHCFQFLLSITMITVAPREIEDDGYAKLVGGGGLNKVHYGLCEKGEWEFAHFNKVCELESP